MCTFKETRNRFPAWPAGKTILFAVPGRHVQWAGGLDSWAPETFTNTGSVIFFTCDASIKTGPRGGIGIHADYNGELHISLLADFSYLKEIRFQQGPAFKEKYYIRTCKKYLKSSLIIERF
jgi:hypothetical protein